MKKLKIFIVAVSAMLLVGCGASRVDQKAQELNVTPFPNQMLYLIENHPESFKQTYDGGDKFLILTLLESSLLHSRKVKIKIKNPDPIKKSLKWRVAKPAKFVDIYYKNVKIPNTIGEAMQEAANEIFQEKQKEIIKENKKYNQRH